MGVPKFFRFMSERYPCLSELLRENQVPEFDNLYLDMNGIIHNCSHPNDADINFRISEEMIFEGIFNYVEYLFKMIRPQQVFFIAVDGVAPRAKMNQQRGRRFRSAFEAQELLDKAIAKGETIPSGDRFDSNCITPGTAFMVRLQKGLEHFIQVKIATDPMWKACTVILSGHETPGEGEHKIMEFIRHAKAQPNFNPNTRHCLYGLDADLIMLGLCTHERYFSLLREEVKFGKNDAKTAGLKEIRFYLLHLTLLSEYLELEFASIRNKLPFQFDINKLIDDWILLLYLVGNDFIPHLPHLHISENALPTLYAAYMDVLPEMDGYINEAGILNLPRLQSLMRRLARLDRDIFLDRYTDLKYLEGKCGKDNLEAFDVSADEIIGTGEMDKDLMALIMSSELDLDGTDDEGPVALEDLENDPELFEKEFKTFKRNYYMTKMGYADFTEEVRAEQAECYIRALQWTLHYYYRGVVSWSWYYPHHYAPFISDIDHFADVKLNYELAQPFLPFQQLLSVLPAGSKQHLPTAYHQLMVDPNSSVYDFYPPKFSTDLNGKQQAWEAVVLIPFIDEKRLLKAMDPCDSFLTDEEKQRNVHGPMLQFRYDKNQTAPLEAKYGFNSIDALPVRRTEIWRDELRVAEKDLVLGPSQGAVLHGYAKGFPTFKHLTYHGVLKELRIKVFNFPSKNDSMVVVLDAPEGKTTSPETAELAKELLGKIVHVSWPHLMEAIVVRVSDRFKTYERNSEPLQTDERAFKIWCTSINEHNNNRLAVDVGPIKQLVHVRTCVGSEYVMKDNDFVLNKLWNNIDVVHPAQTIVRNLHDVMKQQKSCLKLNEMFPTDGVVFLRATESYGSMGHVADVSGFTRRVQARFLVYEEPDLEKIFQEHERSLKAYRNVNDTAAMLGVSPKLLLQLTGTLLVAPGGHRALNVNGNDEKLINIGLRLRMISKDEEAVGYCRKVNNMWLFSCKTVDLIRQYMERVPNLLEKLEYASKTSVFFETDLFGEGNEGKLQEFYDWLKLQDHVNAERRSCGIQLLEQKAIEILAEQIDHYRETNSPKVQTLFVDPVQLYRPGMKKAKTIDPAANFELLDRVIVVQEEVDVPLGARGTIIGIHRVTDPNPVRREAIGQGDTYFEILFDQPHHKCLKIFNIPTTDKRVLRVSQGTVLNISFGKSEAGFSYKVPVTDTRNAFKTDKTSKATVESIEQRMNERIGKRDNVWRTNKATKLEPSQQGSSKPGSSYLKKDQAVVDNQLKKVEFERVWRKLKETPKNAGDSLFEESDIKSFVQSPRQLGCQQNGIVVGNQLTARSETANNKSKASEVGQDVSRQHDGDNVTENLKQLLRISDAPVKGEDLNTSQVSITVPAPASLPKPPISWRMKDKCSTSSTEAGTKRNSNNNRTSEKNSGTINPKTFIAQYATMPPPLRMPESTMQQMNFQPSIVPRPVHTQPLLQQPGMHPAYVPTVPGAHPPFVPSFPPRMLIRPPMPFGHRNEVHSLPPPSISTPFNPGFSNSVGAPGPMQPYPTTWGPKGPQNLSYNRNNPAGNGAFVPLQAMKKTVKGRNGPGACNNSNHENTTTSGTVPNSSDNSRTAPTVAGQTKLSTTGSFNEKNARRRQEVEKKQAEVEQAFASFLSDGNQKTEAKQVKNKNNVGTKKSSSSTKKEKIAMNKDTVNEKKIQPRQKSRIAARFGSAPDG